MARKTSSPQTEKRTIHAPIEAVYRAFLEPASLKRWLGAELDLVPELNGKFCVTGQNDDRLDGHIEIIAWLEQLLVSWDGGSLDLQVTTSLGGTTASLTTTGSTLWVDALAKLDAYLQRPGRR